MQLSKTFRILELGGYLLDGLSLVKKGVAQAHNEYRFIHWRNFKQLIRGKNEVKLGTLFTIMI